MRTRLSARFGADAAENGNCEISGRWRRLAPGTYLDVFDQIRARGRNCVIDLVENRGRYIP
jgi:hypothetical protein